MVDFNDELQVQTVVLEHLKYKQRQVVGAGVLATLKLTEMPEFLITMGEGMAYELMAEMLAEKIGSDRIERIKVVQQDFEITDGPFQRWKQRHALSWWLRWFVKWRPVRTVSESKTCQVVLRVEVEDYAAFPHSSYVPAPAEFGPPVFQRFINSRIETKEL